MSQKRAAKQQKFQVAYKTEYGTAYQGDSLGPLGSAELIEESVDLIVTSPPSLTRKKDYGNEDADEYVEWFLSFVEPFKRVLKPSGSLVIDIGGAYLPGRPQRSTYHFLITLNSGGNLTCARALLVQPRQTASSPQRNVRRMGVKDSATQCCGSQRIPSTRGRQPSSSQAVLSFNGSPEEHSASPTTFEPRRLGKIHERNDGAIPPNLLGASDDQTDLEGEIFESLPKPARAIE